MAGALRAFAVVDDGGEGVGGAVGDVGEDGDLVHAVLVEQLDVERVVELLLELAGCVAEDVAEEREGVEQAGIGLIVAGASDCSVFMRCTTL